MKPQTLDITDLNGSVRDLDFLSDVSFDTRDIHEPKAIHLLYLKQENHIDPRCIPPSELALCFYKGQTYLIDQNSNLWDIHPTNQLSVLTQTLTGLDIDGFAVDVLATLQGNPEMLKTLYQFYLRNR